MTIEDILNMEEIENTVENKLRIGELGKLAINDDGKFSVICIWKDNYDHNYRYLSRVFRREKDEESANAFADAAATNAAKDNQYEEDGETLIFGTEYPVYNSKGKHTYTGQIKENMIN